MIIRKLSEIDQKIVALTNEKSINQFDGEELKYLETTLQEWSKFLGVKEPLDQEQVMMFVTFLDSQFGKLSVREITNAIMLGLKGVLEDVNMNHYDTFSSVYLSQILKSYLKRRAVAIYRYKDECALYVKELQKPTEEEKVQMISKTMGETLASQSGRYYELGKKWSGEPMKDRGLCLTYDYLINNDLLDPVGSEEETTPSDKIAYLERVFDMAKERGINFAETIAMKIRKNYEQKKSGGNSKKLVQNNKGL